MTQPVIPDHIVDNAVPQYIEALKQNIDSIMTAGTEVPYLLNYPYQARRESYSRSDKPVITMHVNKVTLLPKRVETRVYAFSRLDFDVHIEQKLVDQNSAGYDQHTMFRLWDIADVIFGNLHLSKQLPSGLQPGVTMMSYMEPTGAHVAQANLDNFGITMYGYTDLKIHTQRTLQTLTELRRYPDFYDPNAPIIEDYEVEIVAQN